MAGSGSTDDMGPFQAVCDWSNLLAAHRVAARGKRGRASAAAFEHRLTDRLLAIQQALQTRTWQPGGYRHFTVHEPKRRRISAAPFGDRVVHHALCRQMLPLFEPHFWPHSYANRVGGGTHRAIAQAQAWLRGHGWVLRCDVRQHFPSIDHALLRAKIARRIHDDGVLWLVDTLLTGGASALADEWTPVYFPGDDLFALERPRGLPIGNLTSQFWSNLYLNDFDWFVVRELGCSAYLRYVDDFALFSHSKAQLRDWRQRLIDRLARERLLLHEQQAQVVPTWQGMPWLGFVLYPNRRHLKQRKVLNFSRRYRALVADYRAGRCSFAELSAHVHGWIAHARHGHTEALRAQLFRRWPVRDSGPD